MGSLLKFNLKDHVQNTWKNINYFESGVGTGTSFEYALNSGLFKNLYGAEIVEARVNFLKNKFKDYKNVKIYQEKSTICLKSILETAKSPFIFWLDGHYPAEEYLPKTYDKSVLLPLQEELNIIKEYKYPHVIFIDDLRIYEKGNFVNGNLPEWALSGDPLIIDSKYNQEKLYDEEGYLILTLKN